MRASEMLETVCVCVCVCMRTCVYACVCVYVCMCGGAQQQIYRCVFRLQCADINKVEGRKLSIAHNQVDPLECLMRMSVTKSQTPLTHTLSHTHFPFIFTYIYNQSIEIILNKQLSSNWYNSSPFLIVLHIKRKLCLFTKLFYSLLHVLDHHSSASHNSCRKSFPTLKVKLLNELHVLESGLQAPLFSVFRFRFHLQKPFCSSWWAYTECTEKRT